MSAICMQGPKEQRISFIFRLFDEDGSGSIDRDEFAELVSGMMLTQSVGDEELKQALQEEFDAADTDNSGELDEKEFIRAASESQRLSTYFEWLSKISMSDRQALADRLVCCIFLKTAPVWRFISFLENAPLALQRR